MRKFSPSVIEEIQYYVYILIDPRDEKNIYKSIVEMIGKIKNSQNLTTDESVN